MDHWIFLILTITLSSFILNLIDKKTRKKQEVHNKKIRGIATKTWIENEKRRVQKKED